MTGVLTKRGNLDADTHTGKMPCEDESRDRGGASPSQGTSNVASKPPGAGAEARNRFSLPALRRNQPANTLILDVQPPGLRDNTFLLFKLHSLWYFVTAALAN